MSHDTRTMLAETVARFAAGLTSVGATSGSAAVWRDVANHGWLRILAAEERGGLSLDLAHVAAVSREFGRAALVTPYVSATMVVSLLASADTPRAAELLEDVMSGARVGVLAQFEQDSPEISLRLSSDACRLNGTFSFLSPGNADVVILPVSDPGGWLVLALDVGSGIRLVQDRCADGSTMGRLVLRDFEVRLRDVAWSGPGVPVALGRARQVGLNAASAELLGLMDSALAKTLDYLRVREQFGTPIGTFQVLQHRAVDLWIQRQLTEVAVGAAIACFDDGTSTDVARDRRAFGAKARASQAALALMSQALQLHGAIGFAAEYGLGAYVNRALTLAAWLGNAEEMRRRYAALAGPSDAPEVPA